jgi:hypothetical protein
MGGIYTRRRQRGRSLVRYHVAMRLVWPALVLLCGASLACGKPPVAAAPARTPGAAEEIVIIESPDMLAAHVGGVVTLHGVVENSKMPVLLGVDVASDAPDLRGHEAWATGRLEQFEEEDPMRDGVVSAGRAAGTRLRLVDPTTGRLAQVQPGAPPK